VNTDEVSEMNWSYHLLVVEKNGKRANVKDTVGLIVGEKS
jgi:hypothetical protein